MQSSVDTLSVVGYGLGLLGFAALTCQLALRPSKTRHATELLLASCAATLWELSGVIVAVTSNPETRLAYELADAIRAGAWLTLAALLVSASNSEKNKGSGRGRFVWVAGGVAAVAILAAFANYIGAVAADGLSADLGRGILLCWIAVSVAGLASSEYLYRNTDESSRWTIKPFCLALAAMFGFDLFLLSTGMALRILDHDLWSIRGLVHALTIPLIVVASVRSEDWSVQLIVSRAVVFRSATVLLSGAYLLAIAAAGYYVRDFGGDWGKAFVGILFFAAVVVLALMLLSGTARSRLRVLIGKHFFSYRYDYREEWLRLTNLLAASSGELSVAERSIKGLADLVESPAGALWLQAEDGSFRPVGCWNVPPLMHEEAKDGSLVAFLERTGWVIDLTEQRSNPAHYAGLQIPDWLLTLEDAWLIIPLASSEAVAGFVLLVKPRAPVDINWEVLDLLKTSGRQAASFLGHVRATESLVEARQFDAFNRMSAFVVHDLKNLVAQLSLMLSNAEKHAGNPAFQRDMRSTIQHVVDRMNRLLLQLRSGATPIENAKPVDLARIIERVGQIQATGRHRFTIHVEPGLRALGHGERLERVIGHLVQNAVDATPADGQVSVHAFSELGRSVIEVVDTGSGMTPEFVKNRLFKPFQTTKASGMGIGAYESYQYVTDLGGRIIVDSAIGRGTRIRLLLPPPLPQAEPSASRQEAA